MDEEKFSELINKNKENPDFLKKLKSVKTSEDLIAFSKEYNIKIEDYELDKVLNTFKYFNLSSEGKSVVSDKDLDASGGVSTDNIDQNLLKMFRSLIQ